MLEVWKDQNFFMPDDVKTKMVSLNRLMERRFVKLKTCLAALGGCLKRLQMFHECGLVQENLDIGDIFLKQEGRVR